MYKNGDDVRQDMFFLKMIELISEILDYKEYATTYKVVAFSQNDGMLEIVPQSRDLNRIDNGGSSTIDSINFLKEGPRDKVE